MASPNNVSLTHRMPRWANGIHSKSSMHQTHCQPGGREPATCGCNQNSRFHCYQPSQTAVELRKEQTVRDPRTNRWDGNMASKKSSGRIADLWIALSDIHPQSAELSLDVAGRNVGVGTETGGLGWTGIPLSGPSGKKWKEVLI
jgi:hypothetical protein